jgi:crotonobetainyl-CoA:carnitine CoA-transferase CaiB-like acyl-CoA transferase
VSGVLAGVRVLEVAHYALAPAAGAVLAEWGADVIKVEDADAGDPVRATAATRYEASAGGFSYMWEIVNRGKRGIALDLKDPDARGHLLELVDGADVFLTSMDPATRCALGIDAPTIRGRRADVIYASASAYGEDGPEAGDGGYDLNAYWCRSGIAAALVNEDAPTPTHLPVPAFGDLQAGLALAGGIAAALLRRERTGEGATVDVSLLATGLWAMQGSILASHLSGRPVLPLFSHRAPVNPLGNLYETADGRHLVLALRDSQPWWPDLCRRLGVPGLADDVRFRDPAARQARSAECAGVLAGIFAGRTLAHWCRRLEGFAAPWDVVRLPGEVRDDPQVVANGFVADLEDPAGAFPLVRSPVSVDRDRPALRRAPAHGEHTHEVLAGGWAPRRG